MTKTIFVLGAGRSTPSLIRYLIEHAVREDWLIWVADQSLEWAQRRIGRAECAEAFALDVNDQEILRERIRQSDLVISMLPHSMHVPVALLCLELHKHLVTASYVSEGMLALDEAARDAGCIFMNEVGVDPGIDHLSALRLLALLRAQDVDIVRFESFTGGLLAPESEKDNPWRYKFTWNPRNVVLAGSGAAVQFLQEGMFKYIPYHRLFRRTEHIKLEPYGVFEGYANRDSLKYIDVYDAHDIQTMYRGTLRRPGFCKAWNIFVQLGMTDDSYVMEGSEDMTFRDFLDAFLLYDPHNSVELKLMHYLKLDYDSPELRKLEWLGFFTDTRVGLVDATPAQILQHILMQKWTMNEDDKDMIAMFHKVHYIEQGERKQMESSMVVLGEDSVFTAMAKTVGLTTAIAAKMILNGTFQKPGVHRPIYPELYLPMLEELEEYGICFVEQETPVRYETLF